MSRESRICMNQKSQFRTLYEVSAMRSARCSKNQLQS